MKNRIYIGIVAVLACLVFACQEADREMYPLSLGGVYFKTDSVAIYNPTLLLRGDTIVYSFAYEDKSFDRYRMGVPVQLTGQATDKARTYHLEVITGSSAQETVDYEPFELEQTVQANKTVDTLWVVWKRSQEMEQRAKQLGLRVVEGGDLVPGVDEKRTIWLQASDVLEQPDWWDAWEEGFGTWHPTKLREWVKIWGREPLKKSLYYGITWSEYPQECTAILKLKDLFEKEEFVDDNGIRLKIPANF